jgi:potassium-transporting ATPase KdpC subunit
MSDEKRVVRIPIKHAIGVFISLWVILGLAYPLAVYGAGQYLFPAKADGSLIYGNNGSITGSQLIGQPFSSEKYFWPRPSATDDYPYNPMASGGSNMGPTNKDLIETISNRIRSEMEINNVSEIPSDLVMASASGLDPHISLESAFLQAPRIAKARGIEVEEINEMIEEQAEKPAFDILGEERVNILILNMALDAIEGEE